MRRWRRGQPRGERDDEAFGNDLAQETGETGSKGGERTLISDMRAETRAIWRLAALAQAMMKEDCDASEKSEEAAAEALGNLPRVGS